MSDLTFIVLAVVALVVMVVLALVSNPEGRNPHVNTRKWWTRNPK